jgi:hypothetical protein
MAESSFQESELYKLHAVVTALDRIAQQLLKPLSISYTEFLVMLSASEASDRTQSDIGRQMGLGKASISVKVKTLLPRSRQVHTDAVRRSCGQHWDWVQRTISIMSYVRITVAFHLPHG